MMGAVEDGESMLTAQQAEQVRALLANREWRLDHLYWIQDKEGRMVRFKRNWAQVLVDEERRKHLRVNILKGRQFGISTYVAMDTLDKCLFKKGFNAGIKDKTLDDAMKKVRKIAFAWDSIDFVPPDATEEDRLIALIGSYIKNYMTAEEDGRRWKVSVSAKSIVFERNSSRVECGATLRGSTLQMLHVSELAHTSVQAPRDAQEVITGCVNAVSKDCEVIFESSHEGGHYGVNYEQVTQAMANEALAPEEWTPLHFKFIFLEWFRHPDYTLPDAKYISSDKDDEYFAQVEADRHVKLTDGQKAWYKAMESVQRSKMKQEYPSSPEEALNPIMDGSIYVHEMAMLRERGDIGRVFEPLRDRPIYTTWDIGMGDPTSIWWVQPDGNGRWLWLDHLLVSGWGLFQILGELRKRDAMYGRCACCILPHDGAKRDVLYSVRYTDHVKQAGYTVIQVPRTSNVWSGIDNTRDMLRRSVFHKRCDEPTVVDGITYMSGVDALCNYRTPQPGSSGSISNAPLHDLCSHPADSARQIADALANGKLSIFLPDNNPQRMAPRRSSYVTQMLTS